MFMFLKCFGKQPKWSKPGTALVFAYIWKHVKQTLCHKLSQTKSNSFFHVPFGKFWIPGGLFRKIIFCGPASLSHATAVSTFKPRVVATQYGMSPPAQSLHQDIGPILCNQVLSPTTFLSMLPYITVAQPEKRKSKHHHHPTREEWCTQGGGV